MPGCPFKDGAKISVQSGGDLPEFGARRPSDARDRSLGRFVAVLWTPKGFGEAIHIPTIDAGDVRVTARNVARHLGEGCWLHPPPE